MQLPSSRYYFYSGGGKGAKRACAPGGTVQGQHFEGRKYEIMKFGCFWRIGVCVADSDIFTTTNTPNTPPVFGPHPLTINAPRHKAVCTPRNVQC